MPDREPQAALAKVAELEEEVGFLKSEMEALRKRHQAQLDAQRAQLDAATTATRAQIEQARMQAELRSIQVQADLIEHDRQTYLDRLNALAAELSEEIDVLLSFSREGAASYYAERVARESEALRRAEEEHRAAQRTLEQKEAEAQASGPRTFAQVAQMDVALGFARTAAATAEAAVRDARVRLETLRQKLARSSG